MKSRAFFGSSLVVVLMVGCGGQDALVPVVPDEPPAETASGQAPVEPTAAAAPAAVPAPADHSSPKAAVESFLANLRDRNKDGALAMGTQEWQAAELGRGSSFVNAVFNEGLKVERWTIDEVAGEGDSASVRARTLLVSAEGEEDNEPMRFTLMRLDDQWWIIELN